MKNGYTQWLFILPLLGACEKVTNTPVQNHSSEQSIVIRNGTRYVECMGYCIGELVISETESSLKRISNNGQKVFTYTWKTEPATWKMLLTRIDTHQLGLLPHSFICLDCKEKSTEWIEIQHKGKTYQIDFEITDTIPAIKPLLTQLHQIYICKKQQIYP